MSSELALTFIAAGFGVVGWIVSNMWGEVRKLRDARMGIEARLVALEVQHRAPPHGHTDTRQ